MNFIKAQYMKWGFKIVELRADQQFESAQSALTNMEIQLNASVQNEHVPDIERLNSTMKERVWSVYMELIRIYDRIPGVLVRDLLYAVTF